MHSETRGAFGTDLCHGLQFGGNDKGCFGCFLNLLNGEFGIVFGKQQTFGSYEHNAHLGDDLCDALNCGVGQFAFFKDFGLALCGVGTFFNMLIHTIRSMDKPSPFFRRFHQMPL